MTRLDAIRARLEKNKAVRFGIRVPDAEMAWLVETVNQIIHAIDGIEPLMLRALLGDNPTAVEWQRAGKPLQDALARLEE